MKTNRHTYTHRQRSDLQLLQTQNHRSRGRMVEWIKQKRNGTKRNPNTQTDYSLNNLCFFFSVRAHLCEGKTLSTMWIYAHCTIELGTCQWQKAVRRVSLVLFFPSSRFRFFFLSLSFSFSSKWNTCACAWEYVCVCFILSLSFFVMNALVWRFVSHCYVSLLHSVESEI